MKRFHVAATVLVAILLGTAVYVAPTVSQADDAASVINARRDLMKNNGQEIKVIINFVRKGEGSFADVSAAAGQIAKNADKIPGLFPKGTGMNDISNPKTGARPEIWDSWNQFVNDAQTMKTLALVVKSAADQKDPTGVADGLKQLGESGCGNCHQTFRQKLH